MDKVRLKGFEITRESLKERFGIEMNDYEWNAFKNQIVQTWEAREFDLEWVVVKHIRNSLESLDFKARLIDGKLNFVRKD